MPANYDVAFTHSHQVTEDDAVSFKCSGDAEKWPWLTLPPTHPIVIQTMNFWASVETGKTRGTFDPTKWSALTYTRWQSFSGSTKPVTHGIADTPPGERDKGKPSFRLTFFDDDGTLVSRMIGAGVVFHTRDFEAWRDAAKKDIAPTPETENFSFAPPHILGVNSEIECFVSPLTDAETPTAHALFTKENCLMPNHPYHGGSGDHVNAGHLADAGFQFAHLAVGRKLSCTGGEITFMRYVELGKPFTLKQTQRTGGSISIRAIQGDTTCTDMTLWYKYSEA